MQMIFAKALQVVRPRDKESEVKDQWFGMVASTTCAYSVLWAPSARVRPSITAAKTLLYSEEGRKGEAGKTKAATCIRDRASGNRIKPFVPTPSLHLWAEQISSRQ